MDFASAKDRVGKSDVSLLVGAKMNLNDEIPAHDLEEIDHYDEVKSPSLSSDDERYLEHRFDLSRGM